MGQGGRPGARLSLQPQAREQFDHLRIGGRRVPRLQQLVPSPMTDLAQEEVLRGGQLWKECRRLEFARDTETRAAMGR